MLYADTLACMEDRGYALTQILDDRRAYQLQYRCVLDLSLHEYMNTIGLS